MESPCKHIVLYVVSLILETPRILKGPLRKVTEICTYHCCGHDVTSLPSAFPDFILIYELLYASGLLYRSELYMFSSLVVTGIPLQWFRRTGD